jgi:hypothetical protein
MKQTSAFRLFTDSVFGVTGIAIGCFSVAGLGLTARRAALMTF